MSDPTGADDGRDCDGACEDALAGRCDGVNVPCEAVCKHPAVSAACFQSTATCADAFECLP